MDFTSGFTATNWVWVGAESVGLISGHGFGTSAQFFGSGKLEIPHFTNNYATFSQFSITFWIKRMDTPDGIQGLVDNGNCLVEPSIMMSLQGDSIGVKFITSGGRVEADGLKVHHTHQHLFPLRHCVITEMLTIACLRKIASTKNTILISFIFE